MYDSSILRSQLENILEALERIPRRFEKINTPSDFTSTDEGKDKLDGICMILIAVGEAFKKLDKKTEGRLLAKHPEIEWMGVKGVRDVIAHGYFDIDAEEIFNICKDDIPKLINTVKKMTEELN